MLKHPRCVDPEIVKDRFSKEAVNELKENYNKVLNEAEKQERSRVCVKELKLFDEAYGITDFTLLPWKKLLLHFDFTEEVRPFELLDYCLLSGDSYETLQIQSFFNFNIQKLTKMRLISTMCDTISCFLGLDDSQPLSQHSLVEGNYVIIFPIN